MLEALSDHPGFEIYLLSPQKIDTQIYANFHGHQIKIPSDLPSARKDIGDLQLDILVYLDIGMFPMTYFLAFARLAPVQCVLGGHPVTTGIKNIDYFISYDKVEPPEGDTHYSEQLIRLPTKPTSFDRPNLPEKLKTKDALNLPADKHIYLCPMKLQKIHPDFDEAITKILQLDPQGVMILFEDHDIRAWREMLESRFNASIPPELRPRILFLPWLSASNGDFISVIAAADVILDPFHFGIGSTLSWTTIIGAPIVTKRGEFMRGRVGAAYCELMEIEECITTDTEHYAQKAVEIACDPDLQEKLRRKILSLSSRYYDNLKGSEGMINFFTSISRVGPHPSPREENHATRTC